MTPKQKAYHAYIKTDHWRELRAEVLKRDGFKCVKCSCDLHLHVHHKFYRTRFEDSIARDLITLCEACHDEEHKIVRKNGRVVKIIQMPGMPVLYPVTPKQFQNKGKARRKKKWKLDKQWVKDFIAMKKKRHWLF